jgi:glycosyltransferase involved in cell wall biosynthesis
MINYSFIIPHHNSPKLLERCLDSVPQRDDIEIIVVDDNSDEEKKAYSDRSDVRIIYIDAEHTKGAGRARNYGMKEARGKWLLFADCDDFYEKDFMVELDKYRESNYDIVFFDAYIQYDVDTRISRPSRLTQLIDNYIAHPESDYDSKMLKHGTNNTWQRMYSREYVERTGALYEEIPACNDGWFVHYLSAHTDNIAAIPCKLYYYVKTPDSIVNGKRSKQVELQIQDAHSRINKLLADAGAYDAIRPFFKGTRKMIKNFGLTFTLYCLIRKLKNEVSLSI